MIKITEPRCSKKRGYILDLYDDIYDKFDDCVLYDFIFEMNQVQDFVLVYTKRPLTEKEIRWIESYGVELYEDEYINKGDKEPFSYYFTGN